MGRERGILLIRSILPLLGSSGPFPKLNHSNFRITSQDTPHYNCIAWTAGKDNDWWDHAPRGYWPEGVRRDGTIYAYIELYESIGYSICDNDTYETGYEKVALFAINNITTHAAKQLDGEKWTSKMGLSEDIEHELYALEGPDYGKVVKIFKRPC